MNCYLNPVGIVHLGIFLNGNGNERRIKESMEEYQEVIQKDNVLKRPNHHESRVYYNKSIKLLHIKLPQFEKRTCVQIQ